MPLRLEDLTPDAQVTGLIGREAVRIVSDQMMGEACDLVFRDGQGNLQSQILFRDREADLELVAGGLKWSFQGDDYNFRLPSKGDRNWLLRLSNPYLVPAISIQSPPEGMGIAQIRRWQTSVKLLERKYSSCYTSLIN